MASLPAEVLLGVYLGLLTGIIPAVISWLLGFGFRYITGLTIPALAVVALGLAIAGANGGLLALNDPTIRGAPNSITLTVAIVVVLMVSLYAHGQGDALGATLPRGLSWRRLRERTLSTDVVELIGGRGHVRVTVAGELGDIEGYPPLDQQTRASIRADEWTFPADLPLSEIERRLSDTLRTEYEIAEAQVTLDERGRATIQAAPQIGGVSKRVPAGRRAVSIGALVPTGLTRGEVVRVRLPDGDIIGTVVSARSSDSETARTDGGDPVESPTQIPAPVTPSTTGGEGRVTLAVTPSEAQTLLRTDRAPILVQSRGHRREFELLSLLRQANQRIRRLTVAPDSELVGGTIGESAIRDRYGIGVLAVRDGDDWTVAPSGDVRIAADAELFVVGPPSALSEFQAVIE